MAIALQSSSSTTLCDFNNLESYSLIWLDTSVNSEENLNAQEKLRSAINHLKTFEQIDQCEEYIRSLSVQDRVILIVGNRLGQQLLTRIHQLQQISSIYIYWIDKQRNQLWTNQFNKVKGVIFYLDELITRIRSDQKLRMENKVNEPMLFNINSDHQQSMSELNRQFLHSLLRTGPISTDKDELISLCEREYQGNSIELTNLDEFKRNYSSDQSVRWYTRYSFLYRILNKALRVQNIDLLLLLRFFIHDIEQQLNQHRYTSPVRLYRGQLISNEELQQFQNSIGHFISINSFLSSTIHRQVALFFVTDSTADADGLQRVLFEIDADPRSNEMKPFANITSLSYFPEEEEVLFMLGSIFRLIDVRRNEDRIWIIRMTLCSDNNHFRTNIQRK